MSLVILKSNISTDKKLNMVRNVFNENPIISKWTVDTEDIDNVLRIEAFDNLQEEEVIQIINNIGLKVEAFTD